MGRRRQQERRAYEKEVLASLRTRRRGTRWRLRQDTLFGSDAGTFFESSVSIFLQDDVARWTLSAKPMDVDPVFWKIMGMEENQSAPLSLRASGAFVASSVPVTEVVVEAPTGYAVDLASRFLAWTDSEVAAYRDAAESRQFSEFVKSHENQRERGAYAATLVCSLVSEGRTEEALAVSECYRSGARSTTCEQVSEGMTFFEHAVAWLERR